MYEERVVKLKQWTLSSQHMHAADKQNAHHSLHSGPPRTLCLAGRAGALGTVIVVHLCGNLAVLLGARDSGVAAAAVCILL